ncbi:MAG TPA: hypothetical protein VHU62_13925 [Mycobacterium sp.]|nr:hypothetical protein [Mycobacterium sp.]
MAAVFTEDAIFQGPHPYGMARKRVADYYAGQAPGMPVTEAILETGRPPTIWCSATAAPASYSLTGQRSA